MNVFRIALANSRIPETPEESVDLAEQAIAEAARERAGIICFPECYVPGYRCGRRTIPRPDAVFLETAWSAIAAAARNAKVAVILGTERIATEHSVTEHTADGGLRITAMVIDADGSIAGFQDKVQLDPSEDATYVPGAGRHIFETGRLKFGIAICHEGFRYPETVRWAAQRGAQVVFHPHFHEGEPGGYAASSYADPANSFHEKAALCRAAENTCYYATVNTASFGSSTTSAVVAPDGTLLCYQAYGKEGLLVADVDLDAATGLLARRARTEHF